jgi:hypothetical protein
MNTHVFHVGDRVRAISAVDGYENLIGMLGTVVHVRGDDHIGVEFDKEFARGHSAGGRGKDGFCRYGNCLAFELEVDVTEVFIETALESLFQ